MTAPTIRARYRQITTSKLLAILRVDVHSASIRQKRRNAGIMRHWAACGGTKSQMHLHLAHPHADIAGILPNTSA